MKSLVFLLLSVVLVGVQCRPAEPVVRIFGVQPDNPNVKVFFTYPTVPPRIDNPNDLQKGAKNEEKEKYVKDVLNEDTKTKGEGHSKAEKDIPVGASKIFGNDGEILTEGDLLNEEDPLIEGDMVTDTSEKDQQLTMGEEIVPEASNKPLLEQPNEEEDPESDRPFTKSKDFASQATATDNKLGGFIQDAIINGREELETNPETEITDEAKEDSDQEGSIVIPPSKEVSPAAPSVLLEASTNTDVDDENNDNGDKDGGPIVIPSSSLPHSDLPPTFVELSNHENDDENIDHADLGKPILNQDPAKLSEEIQIPSGEGKMSLSFDVTEALPDTEMAGHQSNTEDAEAGAVSNLPIAVRQSNSSVPLIPIGVEMVPVMEVVEVTPAEAEQNLMSEIKDEPSVDLTEMADNSEIIMDPIGEVLTRIPNDVNVEVMPNEELEGSPMVLEIDPERHEDPLLVETPMAALSPRSEFPVPIAEVEPNVELPTHETDGPLLMSNEEVLPNIEANEKGSSGFMDAAVKEIMEAELGAVPQTLNRIMPITEAEMPLASEHAHAEGEPTNESEDLLIKPVIEEMPMDQTHKAGNDEIAEKKKFHQKKDEITKDAESQVTKLEDVVSLDGTTTDAIFAANLDETLKETNHDEKEKLIEAEEKQNVNPVEETNQSELVVAEPEALAQVTTASVPTVDPIELALQQETFSNDDSSLNETL